MILKRIKIIPRRIYILKLKQKGSLKNTNVNRFDLLTVDNMYNG